MFLYALEANDGNEKLAMKLIYWCRNNGAFWQKAKEFCAIRVESKEDGNDKEKIDYKDGDEIKNILILITSIMKEKL